MYEDQDYLTIMERIFGRMASDVDKAEGSLLWESTGPAAREFELVYMALDRLINNAYPTTAERSFLERYADTWSLDPYPPSCAVLKAEFIVDGNAPVELGSLFQIDSLYYRVTERLSDTEYRIVCETPGTVGNRRYGQLLPTVYFKGFKSAHIVELLIPGEDVEDTEEFRARLIRHLNAKPYGGNEAEYIDDWVTPMQGVADCKILRCPRGLGTVDVIFIDSLYRAPTPENIDAVQQALMPRGVKYPPEIDNCGLGLAPIGHDVIVYGVKEVTVDIGIRLTYEEGYGWEDVSTLVEETLSNLLLELRKVWGDKNFYTKSDRKLPKERHLTVRLGEIERALLDVPGVLDYDRFGTTINGETSNLDLEWDEVPVLGEVRDG